MCTFATCLMGDPLTRNIDRTTIPLPLPRTPSMYPSGPHPSHIPSTIANAIANGMAPTCITQTRPLEGQRGLLGAMPLENIWTYDTTPTTTPDASHRATGRGRASNTTPPKELPFRTTNPRGGAPTATQSPLPIAQNKPRHHPHHPLWTVSRHNVLGTPMGMNYVCYNGIKYQGDAKLGGSMILVEIGLVVDVPKEAGEYWCACQHVTVCSCPVVTSHFGLWFRIQYGHRALC